MDMAIAVKHDGGLIMNDKKKSSHRYSHGQFMPEKHLLPFAVSHFVRCFFAQQVRRLILSDGYGVCTATEPAQILHTAM